MNVTEIADQAKIVVGSIELAFSTEPEFTLKSQLFNQARKNAGLMLKQLDYRALSPSEAKATIRALSSMANSLISVMNNASRDNSMEVYFVMLAEATTLALVIRDIAVWLDL